MKRLIVFYVLLTIAMTSSGCCRRGFGLWGMRGAPCAPMAPTYTPVPPPAYAPPVCAPPVCQEVPCDPCYGSTSMMGSPIMSDPYSGSTYDGGVIYGGSAADVAPSISTPVPTVPMGTGRLPNAPLSNTALLGVPIFSHVIDDRKLAPGETLNGEVPMPVESAAAKQTSETK